MQVALGILERSATSEQQVSLDDLREDLQEMSTLVNDVLSFSKASMRAVEPRLVEVGVADTVRRVIDREVVDGIHVKTAVEDQLYALADPDLLFRALSNIVRNAVRYAGNAGPIHIDAERSNGSVVIRVSDSGPGLEEKDIESVFEPFYRPEPARARETGGVGLGLAIVKTCIESCRGTVTCHNRRPTGLEVEIHLTSASQGREITS
jgi:two-component system sensor histidine kinase CpxA